jgi:hypothetical protein
MAAHAPRPVRQYRLWTTCLGITVTLIGLALAAVAPSVGPPARWFVGWTAVVTTSNGAFLVMLAFPPRRRSVRKVAQWTMGLWIALSAIMCLPLALFSVPAFVFICHAKCAAWFQDRERLENEPPRRPHHPWGFPRPQPVSPDAPPPPRAV